MGATFRASRRLLLAAACGRRPWVALVVLGLSACTKAPAPVPVVSPDASLATSVVTGRTGDGGPDKVCDAEADRLLALGKKQTAAQLLEALDAAYQRCGDGHGLLGARALVQYQAGNLPEALEAVRREVLAPHPSWRALGLAPMLVEKLPGKQARVLQELGTRPDAPLHVPRFFTQGHDWMEQVVCRGVDSKGFNRSGPLAGQPKLFRAWVECPEGEPHAVFIWQDDPPVPPIPPFSGDRPMPEASHLVDRLSKLFGITTVDELRAVLLDPTPSRYQAWVLERLDDFPELARVWGVLLQEDPDDLEAVHFRAEQQAAMGDLDGALLTLARANPATVRVREMRALGGLLVPSTIRSHQCIYLFNQRNLDEAEARCKEGLALGSHVNSNAYLARIALWRGDLESAETFARASAFNGNAREWTLVGIVLSLQGRPHEAQEWARKAPSVHSAIQLLHGVTKPARQWLLDEEALDRDSNASLLAECGHRYLELNIPTRAERCFAISEGLAYGPAEAQRALHLAETDAPAALRALEPVLKTSTHADVLVAMAFIQHRLGKDAEALPYIERALKAWPGHDGAYVAFRDVCATLGDAGCAAAQERLFPAPPAAKDGGISVGDAGRP